MEVNDGLSVAKQALETLGVKLPRKVAVRHVVMKFLKVKFMLRHQSDNDLLNLEETEDILATSAVKLLMWVCTHGLNTDDEETAVFSALLAMELTLKRGLSPQSPFAFAIYGIAEISLGNVERAYRFGKLALALLNRLENQEAACSTVSYTSTMLSCWRDPMQELMDSLFQVGSVGYRNGDVLFGSHCLYTSYTMHNILGTNLKTLEMSMRETYSMVSGTMGQADQLLLWYQPCLQHTINMRKSGYSLEDVGVLSGEIMEEEAYFRQVNEGKNPILKLIAMLFKAQEAAYFSQYELAASLYEEAESFGGDALHLSHGAPHYYLLAARAYCELAHRTARRRHLRKGRKFTKMLQRMDTTGVPGITPYLAFLRAEAFSRRKSRAEAEVRAAYNQGIACLKEHNQCHFEGMLNERAGFDFVKRGRRTDAEQYFQRAMHLYRSEWGAIAKYDWLRRRSTVALTLMCRNQSAQSERSHYGKYVTVD